LEKSALQSTRSTAGCPALRGCPIDGIYWGDDEEGVILYLKAKGVSPDDITKALAAVAQAGSHLIQQEDVTQPVL
jgi:hypothetical protein